MPGQRMGAADGEQEMLGASRHLKKVTLCSAYCSTSSQNADVVPDCPLASREFHYSKEIE